MNPVFLMAIDPGPVESAYVVIGTLTLHAVEFGKIPNDELLDRLSSFPNPVYIEMIASYGMPVGAEVFQTCVWIGRFMQASEERNHTLPELVTRKPIALHHCNSPKAKDSNVIRALVDRFAPGQPNYGKGTKAAPGFFYGFSKDVWQAMALAVYAADMQFMHKLAGEL